MSDASGGITAGTEFETCAGSGFLVSRCVDGWGASCGLWGSSGWFKALSSAQGGSSSWIKAAPWGLGQPTSHQGSQGGKRAAISPLSSSLWKAFRSSGLRRSHKRSSGSGSGPRPSWPSSSPGSRSSRSRRRASSSRRREASPARCPWRRSCSSWFWKSRAQGPCSR